MIEMRFNLSRVRGTKGVYAVINATLPAISSKIKRTMKLVGNGATTRYGSKEEK